MLEEYLYNWLVGFGICRDLAILAFDTWFFDSKMQWDKFWQEAIIVGKGVLSLAIMIWWLGKE